MSEKCHVQEGVSSVILLETGEIVYRITESRVYTGETFVVQVEELTSKSLLDLKVHITSFLMYKGMFFRLIITQVFEPLYLIFLFRITQSKTITLFISTSTLHLIFIVR